MTGLGPKLRLLLFAVVCAVGAVAVGLVVRMPSSGVVGTAATVLARPAAAPDGPTPVILDADAPAARRLLAHAHFLSIRYPHHSGEPYRVEAIAAADPSGPRVRTGLDCVNLHFRAGRGICVRAPTDALGTEIAFFDTSLRVTTSTVLAGTPSRSRVSPGGRRGAVTNFLSGHSYADAKFTTATTFLDFDTGESTNLEDWATYNGNDRVTVPSRNFWGVTFVDDDHFYVSMGIGAGRYLLRGDATTHTLRVIGDHMECPSVAPDDRHLTFRRSVVDDDGSTSMPLFLLDLRTMREQRLTFAEVVDGQPEWFDAQRILIGTPTGPPNLAVIDTGRTRTADDGPYEILLTDSIAATYVPASPRT